MNWKTKGGIMKIEALRDMPGIKEGDIFNLEGQGLLFRLGLISFEYSKLDEMICKGWFRKVKEENLFDIFVEHNSHNIFDWKDYVKIAKEYFQEHPEEIGCVSKEKVLNEFAQLYENSKFLEKL